MAGFSEPIAYSEFLAIPQHFLRVSLLRPFRGKIKNRPTLTVGEVDQATPQAVEGGRLPPEMRHKKTPADWRGSELEGSGGYPSQNPWPLWSRGFSFLHT